MHNHAALYNPNYDPPTNPEPRVKGWASGAWFIGPDGQTLAQMPGSEDRSDSKEFILLYNVPLGSITPCAAATPAKDFAAPR